MHNSSGFTLIEILIVVMVLGILAMVIIPQITVSTTDAKESTLTTNISGLRNAIEMYYHQHDNVYPGQHDDTGTATTDTGKAATAFVTQLTQYTDVKGEVVVTKDTTHIYGPYLKSTTLPENPFNNLTTVVCDASEDDITVKASSGTAGWKFYTQTGVLVANDGAHDSL
jgi:prepilin-type N-terminal cleavage/methylation domain-containing protein